LKEQVRRVEVGSNDQAIRPLRFYTSDIRLGWIGRVSIHKTIGQNIRTKQLKQCKKKNIVLDNHIDETS